MLADIKRMEAAGQWAEIRQLSESILVDLEGTEMARGLIALAVAHEKTATTAAEYRCALAYARRAVAVATTGSFMATWALHLVSCYAADLGLLEEAKQAAAAFLGALPAHPGARHVAPWVLFALGRVRHYQGRYAVAMELFDRALNTGAAGEIGERIRLFMAWTLAESGQAYAAAQVLPAHVEHVPQGHVSAAMAVIAATVGDWLGARTHALAALRSRGEWATYDTVQAAELTLILRRAAQALGHHGQARVWALHTAAIIGGWNAALRLLPTLRPKGGGEYHDAAAVRGLPAGYHRAGLRGAVG